VVVALTAIGILSFGGLPPLMDTAEAAAKVTGGKRCDEMFPAQGIPPADPSQSPWADGATVRAVADEDTYTYTNQRQAMNGLRLPDDPAILTAIDKPHQQYPEGSAERVYATYNEYLHNSGRKATAQGFESWLRAYIRAAGNNLRGQAFHAKMVKDLRLTGPDWLCEVTIKFTDKESGTTYTRRYDAFNQRTKEGLEFKSGGTYTAKQAAADRAAVRNGHVSRVGIGFGQEQTRESVQNLNSARRDLPPGRINVYQHTTQAIEQYTPGKYSLPGDTLRSIGRGTPIIQQSPASPAAMAEQLRLGRTYDPMGLRVRGPGGVDFSTLELRYVGTPVAGQGLDYSFSADMVDESEGLGYGGQEKAQLVSDSLFTWLALTPEKFWVNLNPDEPDRVIDASFGATDTGRVLLQADLEMKHDYARAMDPRTGVGKELRDALAAENIPCTHGVRNWIVPEPAEVREQDGGIYILDAPLKVNSVPQDFTTPSPNGTCNLTQAQHERVQELLDTMIVPDVEEKVNTDPRYADLRRVYTSRVAAEWIRQQDARQPTDYHSIINSNNVADWPLRGQNASWTPQQTYQEYLKSFTEGDYSYPCQIEGRNATCVMGGVDFSEAPKENIDQARFTTEHTYLPRTTDISLRAMTTDAENKDLLALGGSTATSQSDTGPEPPVAPEPPIDTDSPAFTG
jgi:hypothetical protein